MLPCEIESTLNAKWFTASFIYTPRQVSNSDVWFPLPRPDAINCGYKEIVTFKILQMRVLLQT